MDDKDLTGLRNCQACYTVPAGYTTASLAQPDGAQADQVGKQIQDCPESQCDRNLKPALS